MLHLEEAVLLLVAKIGALLNAMMFNIKSIQHSKLFMLFIQGHSMFLIGNIFPCFVYKKNCWKWYCLALAMPLKYGNKVCLNFFKDGFAFAVDLL